MLAKKSTKKNRRKDQLIEWRRSKELEYSSLGYKQADIARELRLNEATVSRDFSFLREQAKVSLRNYIQNELPLQLQRSLTLLDIVKREAWHVAQSSDGTTKIRALAHLIKCTEATMNIVTNVAVLDESLGLLERESSEETLVLGRSENKENKKTKAAPDAEQQNGIANSGPKESVEDERQGIDI